MCRCGDSGVRAVRSLETGSAYCVQSTESVIQAARVWDDLSNFAHSFKCRSTSVLLGRSRATFLLRDACRVTIGGKLWLSAITKTIVPLAEWKFVVCLAMTCSGISSALKRFVVSCARKRCASKRKYWFDVINVVTLLTEGWIN